MNIKLGDSIGYCIHGCSGNGKIIQMELTERCAEKEGIVTSIVGVESIKENKVVFDVDVGKFVYSYQVRTINGVKIL